MVPKKIKSKRMPATHKYKVQRKVREHNRKMRKASKSNPNKKTKLKKDPGIPSLFPYKEKLLHQIEETKRKAEEEKEAEKQARLEARRIPQKDSLTSLVESANERAEAFQASNADDDDDEAPMLVEATVSGSKDNSRKAYYKEFKNVVESADVILEVLDARDPLGCRTRQIEEMILASGTQKRVILVLNKIDLVPKETVEEWLKYLREELPTIAFKANTSAKRDHLGHASVKASAEQLSTSSECLGADTLLKLLKNYCRNGGIKTSITVGVVGFPNVGKSSVINSLKRSKVCQVGSTPGVTKSSQEIHLDKNIKLLDCPGIVFSRQMSDADAADVVLRNCVKVELVADPIAPVERIVARCKREQLMLYYKIPAFLDTKDFLIQLARLRGRLRKGGIADLESTAKSVLNDWNAGRIPYFCIPPIRTSQVSSAIVAEWAKEFKLPEIITVEADQEILQAAIPQSEGKSKFLAMSSGNSMQIDMDGTGIEESDDDEEMDVDEEDDYDDEEDGEEMEED
ncbi:hypothetical protein SmJEL517_g05944 [Synchytrium microbalum]|uniref:CP-type G domain-containing protein n=1 Tax=Synchytrium microbalum TaxID=1806994 RepID=A0A507BT14_9FUNG|nr:uncharacterized protein SmJEL517_g05944 [Synchytrium microbalum]TPX30508.1 hypothetical protein SmJEL517_g05944 [Synchytrium microbalum]